MRVVTSNGLDVECDPSDFSNAGDLADSIGVAGLTLKVDGRVVDRSSPVPDEGSTVEVVDVPDGGERTPTVNKDAKADAEQATPVRPEDEDTP
jgi:hypothetical protein